MAERSASGMDNTMSSDFKNFEHGTVSSDAVYVPHSKQSSRGRRGRGKSWGNYRHGQHQNDSLDRLEFDGSEPSAGRSKYSGGRGQKPAGMRNQYRGRRNPHSAGHDARQLRESNAASFGDIADSNPPFAASSDTHNGVHRTHLDETELNAPPFHVREHVGNSRVPWKPRDDHRYEERSQKHSVDQQPSRRGRHAYSRGRGHRGVSNYYGDEIFATVNTQDASLQNNRSSEAAATFEGDLRGVTEFTNSSRKNFGSKAQFGRHLKSNSENQTPKDDRSAVHKSAALNHDKNSMPGDLHFHDLRIATEAMNLPSSVPNNASGQAVVSVKMKNTDPEFETQRGDFLLDDFMYVCRISS